MLFSACYNAKVPVVHFLPIVLFCCICRLSATPRRALACSQLPTSGGGGEGRTGAAAGRGAGQQAAACGASGRQLDGGGVLVAAVTVERRCFLLAAATGASIAAAVATAGHFAASSAGAAAAPGGSDVRQAILPGILWKAKAQGKGTRNDGRLDGQAGPGAQGLALGVVQSPRPKLHPLTCASAVCPTCSAWPGEPREQA